MEIVIRISRIQTNNLTMVDMASSIHIGNLRYFAVQSEQAEECSQLSRQVAVECGIGIYVFG